MRGFTTHKRCLVVAVMAAVLAAATLQFQGQAQAEITREDGILLSLMFRSRYVPYSQGPNPDPAVIEISEKATEMGWGGDPLERYRLMIKGMAIMVLGEWNEGIEAATVLDMRLPAKLYEPGDTIRVKVFPVYEWEGKLSEHYVIHTKLLDPEGNTVGKEQTKHIKKLEAVEISLAIPAGASSGRYAVEYSLAPHDAMAETIMTGQRGLYVLDDLRARLAALAKKRDDIRAKGIADKGKRQAIAASTIDWHLDIYNKGLTEDIPGAYTGHPIFMTSIVAQAGMVSERMAFVEELALPEGLADGLLAGDDPLRTQVGDMRLAYVSPADQERVPFRIFVPDGYDPTKTYPLVVALHGAGGDENSFMNGYQGLFKENAQKHGYIAVSVNGRGPYGGYRGKSGQDVTDVLDLVQEIYPIITNRTYLTGHSMGGSGTVTLGFNHADRFAALAPIAGFGSVAQLEKAKDMPLFIGQGDEDALVPVDSARAFYEAGKKLGMPNLKYVEKPGVDHIVIVDLVMADIFDWFDAHTKE